MMYLRRIFYAATLLNATMLTPQLAPVARAQAPRVVRTQSTPVAPAPSDAIIVAALKSRGLVTAGWMTPVRHTGDFDGDGQPDVALLVAHVTSKKRGILILHAGRTTTALVGAGVNFGNGGDDFEWANRWVVMKRKGKPDALLIEREEAGGGLVEFVAGKYRWRQQGD
ncbi:MAG: hypothetical protein H7Z40_21570 [Phycisphaerae bacterium]|nr:hypothetical protein [Gemmatimonadaceae bacterium]